MYCMTCVQAERLDLETNVYPGEVWTANQQCQTFLLDSDARIDHTDKDFAVITVYRPWGVHVVLVGLLVLFMKKCYIERPV